MPNDEGGWKAQRTEKAEGEAERDEREGDPLGRSALRNHSPTKGWLRNRHETSTLCMPTLPRNQKKDKTAVLIILS